ncbi:hypothetical protein TUMSATVNIG1_59830 (plasmid) [Vibrio nigripulchritudo]|uniref:hypothetical protein n=1 Tax=Vibrio nigripulchritudo TaxID=28173 RepID=UPI0019094B18|nr:hypothetical protein [Vibrio nigripulchritudo]BCL73997.1 hypothetical protein VNTUMSATTG_59340 [Vibrio nigripulchritudo]BDU35374.1 hypothetical protein TUMSATVNIG1_59830 [Vibrio nigripulchritudo]
MTNKQILKHLENAPSQLERPIPEEIVGAGLVLFGRKKSDAVIHAMKQHLSHGVRLANFEIPLQTNARYFKKVIQELYSDAMSIRSEILDENCQLQDYSPETVQLICKRCNFQVAKRAIDGKPQSTYWLERYFKYGEKDFRHPEIEIDMDSFRKSLKRYKAVEEKLRLFLEVVSKCYASEEAELN